MPVMEAQDACPHTQGPYLSGAAVLGAPSAGKSRGLAVSSGLRLWAAEQRKNPGQPWPRCWASYRQSPCMLPLLGNILNISVPPPQYVEILTPR